MKLNLSKFKKISDDPKMAVLQHPAGHKITIAKKSLSKQMHEELSALPMHRYAEGGEVSSESDSNSNKPVVVNVNNGPQPNALPPVNTSLPPYDPNQASLQLMQNPQVGLPVKEALANKNNIPMSGEQIEKSLPQGVPHQAPDVQPLPAETTSAQNMDMSGSPSSEPAQNQDPYGLNAFQNEAVTGINEQKAGLFGAAKAMGAQGQRESQMLGENIQRQQNTQDRFEHYQDQLLQERSALQQDLQNQHIDPNHYINSMSTGKKIKTILGLIVGGIGGPDNAAMQLLQKNIDNDIAAQQSELGKKKNLLDYNNQTLGNSRLASDMSRVMTNDILSSHLKQIAAKSQGSIESFRALQAAGQLDFQNAGLTRQIAQQRALLDSLNPQNQGNGGAQNPADQQAQTLNAMRVLNPEMAKNMESRFVPKVGLAQVPVPEKARDEMIARTNLDLAVGDLEGFARKNAGTVMDRARVNEGAAKARLVQDAYRRANAQGVFREAEKNFVEGIVDQDPTKFFNNWRTEPKYRALRQDNLRTLNGLKQGYGLPSTPEVKDISFTPGFK